MANGKHMTPELNWYLRLYSYIQEKRKRDINTIRFITYEKEKRDAILKYGSELGYHLSFVWKRKNGLYLITIHRKPNSLL